MRPPPSPTLLTALEECSCFCDFKDKIRTALTFRSTKQPMILFSCYLLLLWLSILPQSCDFSLPICVPGTPRFSAEMPQIGSGGAKAWKLSHSLNESFYAVVQPTPSFITGVTGRKLERGKDLFRHGYSTSSKPLPLKLHANCIPQSFFWPPDFWNIGPQRTKISFGLPPWRRETLKLWCPTKEEFATAATTAHHCHPTVLASSDTLQDNPELR